MRHLEHSLQVSIVRYLRLKRFFVFAIPNGGWRKLKEAVRLKEEGVMAGVSDLIIVLPERVVFVELKNGNAGKQSGAQKIFQAEVQVRGFEYLVWRSLNDVIEWVEKIK